MPSAHLRIDTSRAPVAGPSHDRISTRLADVDGKTPGSSSLHSARPYQRQRSASTSSTMSNPPHPREFLSSGRLLPDTSQFQFAVTEASIPPSSSPTASESEPDNSEYVLAMHDFIPQQSNVTCLAFQAGQVIRVLNRDPSGWWDGEVDRRRGWFPSNYVTSDVGLLTDEELPQLLVSIRAHISLPSTPNFNIPALLAYTNATC